MASKINPYSPFWSFFLRLKPILGKQQKYQRFSSDSLLDMSKSLILNPDSEFYLVLKTMSSEFKLLNNWLSEQHKNKVKIKILTANIEEELQKDYLAYFIENGFYQVRKVDDYNSTVCLGLSTDPKQIWFEGRHKDKASYEIYYCPQPYPKVWDNFKKYFDQAWNDPINLEFKLSSSNILTPIK